jgi:probable HAF family extracellular repeat protein
MTAIPLLAALLSLQSVSFSPSTAQFRAHPPPQTVPPDAYVVDFVATAARGVAMNDVGVVAGTSYEDVGCGSFCLPPMDTVVWARGNRIVLPSVPGLTGIYVRGINRRGWVVGLAGYPGTATHAVVWIPSGGGYQVVDLGTLPGTNSSEAIGIDERGRVIGWSTTTNFPPSGSPFLWTAAGGMVDLSAQGFPDEIPLAISPGGVVATTSSWYRLDDPASVTPLAAPPTGYAFNAGSVSINDEGDQGRFLVRTSGQNLVYLYRYHSDGTWQQLSAAGTGHLSNYGIGSIDAEGTVTATIRARA